MLFAEIVAWEKPEKEGPWYQMKSGYYVIWYEKKDESIALELARVGQAMYEDYKDLFGDKSPEKVYVQIHSRTGYPNGSYDSFVPIINLYTYSKPFDTKGFDWNYYLLSHEFLHYMHLEHKGGPLGVLTFLFGPSGRIPIYLTPDWGIEGFATAVESDYTSSGRYYNPIFTMPYRADIILNNPNTYLEITRNKLIDEAGDYARRYQYGVQLMYYTKERYGYEYLAEIWQDFMNFPIGYRERYKERNPGHKFIFDEMIEHDRQKYEQYKSWSRGTELKSKENDRAIYSVIGASEKGVLIYQKGTDVKSRYVLFNPKTLEMQKLFNSTTPNTDFFNAQPADISKNGKYMTYIVPVLNTDMLEPCGSAPIGVYNDVYTYNLETRKHKRITKKQQLSTPVISNDGKYIYATQFTNSGNHGRLIKIDINQSKQGYDVLYEQEKSMVFYKAISPNGKKIVFVERSSNFGVKLQLLDLETKEIHTLIQRDYGLWITSPNFVDDNTISIVADLEHTAENAEMYTINISDIQAPIWTRIGRDKVGFHSAVLSVDDEIVYSSHNSKGYSIFTYKNNEAQYYPIDINELPLPDFYHENNLQRYLNRKIVKNPELAPQRRQPIEAGKLEYKKSRIVEFLPTRPRAYYPTAGYNTLTGLSFHYNLIMMGKTQKSLLQTRLSYYFNPFIFTDTYNSALASSPLPVSYYFDINNMTYQATYGYTFSKIGRFTLESKREFLGYVYNTNYTYIVDYKKHFAKWARILLYTPRNYYLLASFQTDFSNASIHTKSSDDFNVSLLQMGNNLNFMGQLSFGWSSRDYESTLLSENLAWRIAPFAFYTPPVLDQEKALYRAGALSYINIPIIRRLSTKLSNYTFWYSETNGSFLNTERFRRYASLLYFPNVGNTTLVSGKGASVAPLQSSVAMDILIPWGHANAGFFMFEPYKFYTNIFAEQSFGYDIDNNKFEMNKYLITGLEAGMRVRIIFVSLDFKLGGAYKIPYDDTSDQGSYLYISIGEGTVSDLHGNDGVIH